LKRGVRFDAWEEYFDYDNWMDIFASCGVDPSFYANRTIPDEEILPWDMIDCGVTKEFLLRERHKAAEAATTPSCKEQCSGCGVNRLVDSSFCRWCPGHKESSDSCGVIAGADAPLPPVRTAPAGTVKAVREVRVRFRKHGPMLYISHLDLAKTMTRAIVRSGLPVYYTEGFNPIPKLVFATPLSVGCGGEREILDLRMMEQRSNVAIRDALRAVMPDGLEVMEVYTPKNKIKDIIWAENEIIYSGCTVSMETAAEIEEMFRSPVTVMKRSKSGEKETDITTLIKSLRAEVANGKLRIIAITSADSANYLNPEYIAQVIEEKFAVSGENGSHIIMRTKLFLDDGVTEIV